MNSSALEFKCEIDQLFNTYLDSTYGFHLQLKELNTAHEETIEKLKITNREKAHSPYVHSQQLTYTFEGTKINRGTNGDSENRNRENGLNWQLAGKMFIVFIFELWEQKYRSKISEEIGIPREKLEVSIFGEIRHIRNWIIHGTPVVPSKMELINWFKNENEVTITFEKVNELISMLRHELSKIVG